MHERLRNHWPWYVSIAVVVLVVAFFVVLFSTTTLLPHGWPHQYIPRPS